MDFSRWKAGSLVTTLIYQKWEDQHHLHETWGHLWNTWSTVKRRLSSSTAAGRPLTQQQIELPGIRLLSYHTYPELYALVLANAEKRITVWKSRCCSKWTCSVPASERLGGCKYVIGGHSYVLTGWGSFGDSGISLDTAPTAWLPVSSLNILGVPLPLLCRALTPRAQQLRVQLGASISLPLGWVVL